jgi:two-component system sensor histidine kinase/response regulator
MITVHDDERVIPPEELAALRGASVLVVEDSRINQQIAEELLTAVGVAVTLANHGEEALVLLQQHCFDAVLMDLQMPVMDGFVATGKIRAFPSFRDLPVIAMTADAKAEDREASLTAGMNDHVVKSLDPFHLYRTLLRWVKLPEAAVMSDAPAKKTCGSEDGIGDLLPESLSGIDLAIALRVVRNNRTLLARLLVDFHAEHSRDVENLRESLRRNDLALARRIVHTLVGIAGSLGAVDIHAAAIALDERLRRGADAGSLIVEIMTLEYAFTPVMETLGAFAAQVRHSENSRAGTSQTGVDAKELAGMIDELRLLMDGYSPDAERKAREIHSLLRYHGLRIIPAEELLEELGHFEFEKAVSTLSKLVESLKANR